MEGPLWMRLWVSFPIPFVYFTHAESCEYFHTILPTTMKLDHTKTDNRWLSGGCDSEQVNSDVHHMRCKIGYYEGKIHPTQNRLYCLFKLFAHKQTTMRHLKANLLHTPKLKKIGKILVNHEISASFEKSAKHWPKPWNLLIINRDLRSQASLDWQGQQSLRHHCRRHSLILSFCSGNTLPPPPPPLPPAL